MVFRKSKSVRRKSAEEIERMRESGRIVGQAHALVRSIVRPGVTTGEIDKAVEDLIRGEGATPSFKGYHGFPGSICASVNEEVVHGIPGDRELGEGDLVSIDIGAYKNGFHGDSAWTYPVGSVSQESEDLLVAGESSLRAGVFSVKPGGFLWEIGAAIEADISRTSFSLVDQYVGHGVGRDLHEEPPVHNVVTPSYRKGAGSMTLEIGMVLAIEPMVNAGSKKVVTGADQWTVVTSDRKNSTHFEHTVAVVEDGFSVLTLGEFPGKMWDSCLPENGKL